MNWFAVGARGATRDLWVRMSGNGAPEFGRWTSPAGIDVKRALAHQGPKALDVEVRWIQEDGHQGERLCDLIWDTGMSGFKIVSERMVQFLRERGARLEVFPVDIRLRDDSPVAGYLGVLEEFDEDGPVHSEWPGRRSERFIVSASIREEIEKAGLIGLKIDAIGAPYSNCV